MTGKTLRDIIVTTPQKFADVAAEEARQCIEAGGGFYFRTFRNRPKDLEVGIRIYYVEHPYIRGFGTVSEIVNGNMVCGTTRKDWGDGYHAIMSAYSWEWIKPIAMKGFQGWRYFDTPREEIEIIGNWLDPKPNPDNYL